MNVRINVVTVWIHADVVKACISYGKLVDARIEKNRFSDLKKIDFIL